jgi:uncharacterized protein (TIGR02996 family)
MANTVSLEQAFQDAIAQDPSDPTAKLVYADWLGEQGDSLEGVVRWCAAQCQWPDWREGDQHWHWWSVVYQPSPALLPENLWRIVNQVPSVSDEVPGLGRWFDTTVRGALTILDRALKVREAKDHV